MAPPTLSPAPGAPQEIYKDRQKFSEQVFNVASSDLVNMGISVVSYTLKDIHDDQVAPGRGGTGGDAAGTRVAPELAVPLR